MFGRYFPPTESSRLCFLGRGCCHLFKGEEKLAFFGNDDTSGKEADNGNSPK